MSPVKDQCVATVPLLFTEDRLVWDAPSDVTITLMKEGRTPIGLKGIGTLGDRCPCADADFSSHDTASFSPVQGEMGRYGR